jgi:hypothetical protein
MRLKSNHEIVGTLSDIKLERDQVKLLFTTMREIELPKEVLSYKQLKAFLGERVGVLNVNGEFLFV